MRFLIRGQLYPNAAAVARALGVTSSTVYSAAARDALETLGLGTPRRGRKPAIPVAVGGLAFSSMAELARYLGWSSTAVRKALIERRKSALHEAVVKRQTQLEKQKELK